MKYTVKNIENLQLECSEPLSGMYRLSPYVWKENELYKILIRAVNPSEDAKQKVARIYYGHSSDGISFKMSDGPAIAPSTSHLDKDGCEDPTVVFMNNQYFVYYTGWNQTKLEGQLLLSKGSTIDSLKLMGIAIPTSDKYKNPKEATVFELPNKEWVLWFEYANESRSKLGLAISKNPDGPWEIQGEYMESGTTWDNYHLSAGPVVANGKGGFVMFYNGSNNKTQWRIGWIEMDGNGKVVKRSSTPLVVPPPPNKNETDIAFAASAVLVGEEIWLYYSIADCRVMRAIITMK